MAVRPAAPLPYMEWASRPDGTAFWWIPVDDRSWSTLFSAESVRASSAARFRFDLEDEPKFLAGKVAGLEDWLGECVAGREFAVAAVAIGEYHMTYLLSTVDRQRGRSGSGPGDVRLVQLDTWGDYESPLSAAFSRCVRVMCARVSSATGVQFHYLASVDYWRPRDGFRLGSLYPAAGLCVTLPRLLMDLVVRERVPLAELADFCAHRLDRARADVYLAHLAGFNFLLDVLLSVFEDAAVEDRTDHWLYGRTRQSFDRIYSTVAQYAGLFSFPALIAATPIPPIPP
jgi:hypothetical protein